MLDFVESFSYFFLFLSAVCKIVWGYNDDIDVY